MLFDRINPTRIRLEASSVCQLSCPSCPVHSGVPRPAIGNGFLALSDFKGLVLSNPRVREIELSNYGEILLNPDLLGILEFAHEQGVALRAETGVNLNRVSEEVLEGLVRYELRSMTCSIDGASDQSYRAYRVNGDFSAVLANIQKLNALKRTYRSEFPQLTWQFVVFGHNEHEIPRARALAHSLGMAFRLKLAWDPDFSPIGDRAALRRELGAADREEYRESFGVDYVRDTCLELWRAPQVNWDGRVLGCCRNFWGDFGANVFVDGLLSAVNSPEIRYARRMLLGSAPPREGIPCTSCSLYADMQASGNWVDRRQILAAHHPVLAGTWRPSERVCRTRPYRGARYLYRLARPVSDRSPRLTSMAYPLLIPLAPDEETGWRPYDIFGGHTEGLRVWSCHASVLIQGGCPHPPHRHVDEEILLLLSGEVDLLLPEVQAYGGNGRIGLRPGQFVYYPSNFPHTLETTSEAPANYLMFRWSAGARRPRRPLAYGLYDPFDQESPDQSRDGFSVVPVFEGPTKYLRKLHCHASIMPAGRGYGAHVDEHDVAVVVQEGEVETLGQRVMPHGVIMYAAGEPHGMHNPGRETARYVVFEFHSRGSGWRTTIPGRVVGRLAGIIRAGRRG